MKKLFALFAVALLVGTGWLALSPAGSRDTRHAERSAGPAVIVANDHASPARTPLQDHDAPAPRPRNDAALAVDYDATSPQRDGSGALQFRGRSAKRPHPGHLRRRGTAGPGHGAMMPAC